MAKTTMTKERRAAILEWMYNQYDEKHLPALQKVADKAMTAASKAIRTKYPENDMAVLRKYKCTRADPCVKLVNIDTQYVFGVDFRLRFIFNGYTDVSIRDLDMAALAEVPDRGGCSTGQVYPISTTGMKAIDEFTKAAEKFRDARRAKFVEYGAFTLGCKSVEDFHAVIKLPKALADRLMVGGALIHLSEEKIDSLRKEFAA